MCSRVGPRSEAFNQVPRRLEASARHTVTIESKAERVAANGRPLGRGGVSRDQGFSPSTRVGCSRTGPGRNRIAFDSSEE